MRNHPFLVLGRLLLRALLDFSERGLGTRLTQYTAKHQYTSNAIPGLSSASGTGESAEDM